jgi:nitrogenase molybdenum-cofactor synthesis protein NifE
MSIARQLDEKYSIPWLEGSFYGMKQTKDTLLGIAKIFEDVGLAGRIKRVTERLEQETMERLQPYLPKLKGKKVLVYTGGVKSWSVLYQLEELGMEVIKSSTRKSTDEDIERMLHIFKGDESALMPKGDGKTILSIMKEHDADLLLAGGRNMYTAMKGQVPFVDVNQERLFAYAGYDGMVELAKRLVYTMESPVFELAASKAPWEV